MRCQHVALVTLLAVSVGARAGAQVVTPAAVNPAPQATPDAVVARLMSFDRNHDGRIVRGELPERMQPLLSRGDASQDGSLDSAEVRRLAESPAPAVVLSNGLQVGHYGFGDGFDFDTRLHIDGALDDLRLASETNNKAREIAHTFMSTIEANATADLMASMKPLLSTEHFGQLKAAVEGQPVTVSAVQRDGVTFFGATADEAAGQAPVVTVLRPSGKVDVVAFIKRLDLEPGRNQQALAAAELFAARNLHRLTDTDRTVMLAQLRGLLSDEQRDDLRAALERRPLVKQPQQPQPVVFKVKQIAKLDELRAIDAGSVSDEQLQLQLRSVQETLLTR